MVTNKSLFVRLLVSFTLLTTVCSQTNGTTQTSGSPSTTTTPKTSPATSTVPPSLPPNEECPKHNGSCENCIKAANYQCFYCYDSDDGNKCIVYPVGSLLPIKECDLSKARWGVCWVNFEALIITMSVIGGIIILTITCCCVRCFCCSGGNKKKYVKEEAKWERQKSERKQRSDDRKADRKERMDEIRRKYGLVKEDTPYQRFDA